MEHDLKCNILKCRRDLIAQAVVTTCSHIFCLQCADAQQLSNPAAGQTLVCPACKTSLPNPDDAVITNLAPSEDYKTSILSGLSPTIIMECTSRALRFWGYQMSSRIAYEGYLAKSLGDKFNTMLGEKKRFEHDAGLQVQSLQERLSGVELDCSRLEQQNNKLQQQLEAKQKQYLRVQEQFHKSKQHASFDQIQFAAEDAAEDTIQTSFNNGVQFLNHPEPQNQPSTTQFPISSMHQRDIMNKTPRVSHRNMGPYNIMNTNNSSHRNQGIHGAQGVAQTPSSSHRQQINMQSFMPSNHSGNVHPQTNGHSPRMSFQPSIQRQSLSAISPNMRANQPGFIGYGLSSGMKSSHLSGGITANSAAVRPQQRARVAQRPGSVLNTTFGQPASINNSIGQRFAYR